MSSHLDASWLRKCTTMEAEMAECYTNGHRLWHQLDLSSLEPLREEDVRKALGHLYRKVQNLPVCYGLRDGELWMKRATRSDIDFKVLDKESLEDVRSLLLSYQFNTEEGPLICARLLADNFTEDEDLEPTFPQKYHLLFGIHHILVDGFSNMCISGFLIALLNDVIANILIDDSHPLGIFVSNEETLKLIDEKKILIKKDPKLEQQLCKEHQFRKKQRPLALKLSPKQSESKRTINLVTVIDQKTTAQFLAKCKQEKVTVNSLLSSVVNMALVETLSEEGVMQDSYLLQNFHAVNLRRYWRETSSPTALLGCHIGFPLIFNVATPRDVRNNIWEFAKQMNSVMKNDVVSGKILLFETYMMMTLPNHGQLEGPRDYEGDYITSSLGDITDIVTVGGNHVRITSVKGCTGIHGTEFPLLFNYHTYRGRFTISFGFNSKALSTSAGERIYSKVVKFIKEFQY